MTKPNVRNICVVTGTRADYGLLTGLLRRILEADDLHLQLIVTGAHLSKRFGYTVEAIEDDGFEIAARVNSLQDGDNAGSVSRSIAAGVVGMADAFDQLKPNVLVVLGDRYEILSAVQAALIARIPVAHIHGGEVTEGAFDEAIRHAITKMAHIHFTSAEVYRHRVIQMGEAPQSVHFVGAPGLDDLKQKDFANRDELEEYVGIELKTPFVLATYHPVTLDEKKSVVGIHALISALSKLKYASIIFTGVNADPGLEAIDAVIQEFAKRYPDRVKTIDSLGQHRYLSAMNLADVVIGNSSSGIIEAPALQTPTVNIGSRQDGRLRAPSIIDCDENVEDVSAAIERALSTTFKNHIKAMTLPYGDGTASARMIEVLRTVELENICKKSFYDLEFSL